jgi:alkylhydroperoxidase family enzyme
MAGVQPLPPEQLADLSEFFAALEQRMGFVPNSMRTMAYKPDLVRAFSALGRAVYAPTEEVPLSLKNMIAHIASSAAGCKYCMAHTASNATRPGGEIVEEKLDRLYAFETDPIFTEKERAALSFAAKAASIPNTTDDSDFDKLRQFFSDADTSSRSCR